VLHKGLGTRFAVLSVSFYAGPSCEVRACLNNQNLNRLNQLQSINRIIFLTTVGTSVASTLIVSVSMGILGWIYFYSTDYIGLLADKKIDNKLQSAIEKIDGKLQSTTDKLDTLGQRVAKMKGKLDILKIQSLATQPQKGGNAKKDIGAFEHS
jgi:hypothetical protein